MKFELMNHEKNSVIFYIEGFPTFLFLANGEMEPITPDGCHVYINNKEECDNWLKTHSIFRVRFPNA